MSAAAGRAARAATVPIRQKAWAEAFARVEVLHVVERNIIRQKKLHKFLNVQGEFEL
jgi:hypothetical protein